MPSFLRMSKIKRTLVLVMVSYMVIMMLYIGVNFMYMYYQRQSFNDLDMQYRTAGATENYHNFDVIKSARTYQMGVKTRAETKFEDKTTWAVTMMAIGSVTYAILFYTLKDYVPKREYKRPEDYPFHTFEESNDELGVQ